MIFRKDTYYDKLNKFTKNNFEVVMDFDRTITTDDSLPTWATVNGRGILPKEYDFERNALYSYYRPIELDNEVDEVVKMVAMEDWLNKHLDLFKKYQLNKEHILDLYSDKGIMTFRKDFLDLFKYLDNNNIKLDILSAGIGDFFLKFLEMNGCSFVNLDVKSNFLNFDRNGNVIGFKGPLIHALNKHDFAFKKDNKDYVLLIGDQVSDIMMVDGYNKDNILSVAFVSDSNMSEIESYKDVYDMVLSSDQGFGHILNDLKSVIDK